MRHTAAKNSDSEWARDQEFTELNAIGDKLQSRISYFWKEPNTRKAFRTGVSLHSHTNHSRESLSFISVLADRSAFLGWYLEHHKQKASRRAVSVSIDLFRACWTPPLTPREAYNVERKQIEDVLGLEAQVSLTDHDNIQAATLLRVVPNFGPVPISVEWTVPFEEGHFHLGVHNLPEGRAAAIMADLSALTVHREHNRLPEMFRYLNELEGVLIVLNHPKWNIALLEHSRFNYLLTDFLSRYSAFIHAFELNGLRSWNENQETARLASGWNQLVISGGDRHGCEPNGNLNLTNSGSFDEFVHEIRVRRTSHIMFMPQYADPIPMRFFQTFLDVVGEYPDMPEGARNWDNRTFHPDINGVLSPVSTQWIEPPHFIQSVLWLARKLQSGVAPHLWRKFARNEEFRLRLSDGESNV